MITLKATQKGIELLNSNPESNTAIFLLKQTNNGSNLIQTESLTNEVDYLIKNELAELVN